MNINEAYNFVLNKVERLEKEGLEVHRREPIKIVETIEKYNKPNRLSSDNWVTISFNINDNSDFTKVREIESLCKMVGVYFDTGYGQNQIDWEIDWSFRLTPQKKKQKKSPFNFDIRWGFLNFVKQLKLIKQWEQTTTEFQVWKK